ncbi:MAG: ATP-grasp domain-containing protein [Actinobacteria bacterium]|nr:ATP-grasp domain-containing protein [Actinomycetota bacterium]
MTSIVVVGYPDRLRADHACLLQAAQARGISARLVSPSELSLVTESGQQWVSVAEQRVIPDVVLPRGLNRPWPLMQQVLEHWSRDGACIVPDVIAASLCADKVTCTSVLMAHRVPTLATMSVVPGVGVNLSSGESHFGTRPVVVKPARASKGRGVLKFDTWHEAEVALSTTVPLVAGMVDHQVVQPLATGAGCDFRVIVADRGHSHEVVALTRRRAPMNEFVTNAPGALVDDVDMTSLDAERIAAPAVLAARALGLCFAGVDVIEHEGEMVVLEVNAWPGLAPDQRGTSLADALLDAALRA